MPEEKILTKHPQGKTGRNISRQSYEQLKTAILAALRRKELTHTELFDQLNRNLKGKFDGNISWYGETSNSIWKRGRSSSGSTASLRSIEC